MAFKEIKSQFLSIFRQLFVYHHTSLEFRCKLFAAVIAAGPEDKEHMYETLKTIAGEIYENDQDRVEVMVHTAREYVLKVKQDNGLNIDELLISIDKDLKKNRRFIEKINIEHLKRLMWHDCEDINHLQSRVIEFFECEKNCTKQI